MIEHTFICFSIPLMNLQGDAAETGVAGGASTAITPSYDQHHLQLSPLPLLSDAAAAIEDDEGEFHDADAGGAAGGGGAVATSGPGENKRGSGGKHSKQEGGPLSS